MAASPELWGIFQPYAHLSSCRTAKVESFADPADVDHLDHLADDDHLSDHADEDHLDDLGHDDLDRVH